MKPENELQRPIQVATPPREAIREQDKIMLVLCYLGLLALIPLLTVKDSDFVRWHAKNGLSLAIVGFVIATVIGMLKWVSCILGPLFSIAFITVMILAITKSLKGERWRIPGVTELSEKF